MWRRDEIEARALMVTGKFRARAAQPLPVLITHGTRLGSSSRGTSALSSVRARCSARTVLGRFDLWALNHSIVCPIEALKLSSFKKVSACRRNSSATIGGLVFMVETTVTRTPRR